MSKKIEYIISKYKKIYNSYNIFSLRSILIIICYKYCIFTNNKYNQLLNKFVICIVDKKNYEFFHIIIRLITNIIIRLIIKMNNLIPFN